MGSTTTSDEAARLDALRRHLYEPGATDADVQRYVRALGAPPLPEQEEETAAVGPSRRASVHRRAAILVTLAGIAAVAIAAAVGLGPAHPVRPPIARPIDRPTEQDVGDGELLEVGRGTVSPAVAVPVTVRGNAVVGQRFRGHGNAVVTFDPPRGSLHGGRALIDLTSDGSSRTSWRALLRVSPEHLNAYTVVMARGAASKGSAEAAPLTFVYPGRPPRQIAVAAPVASGWTLEIAVTNGLAPAVD